MPNCAIILPLALDNHATLQYIYSMRQEAKGETMRQGISNLISSESMLHLAAALAADDYELLTTLCKRFIVSGLVAAKKHGIDLGPDAVKMLKEVFKVICAASGYAVEQGLVAEVRQ